MAARRRMGERTATGLHSCCNLPPLDLDLEAASPVDCSSGSRSPEDEWHTRLKTTGVSGRMVIYKGGDWPCDDITLDDRHGRIVVSTVIAEGKACRAGVRPGDVLVSIDGRKDFVHKSASEVHAALRAPVALVFIGFVGNLEAEVQLNHPKRGACGLSLLHELVGSASVDEVVFAPSEDKRKMNIVLGELSPAAITLGQRADSTEGGH